MPFPKLSAKLNNCALHALTPELTRAVEEFGSNPELKANNEYELFKSLFAKFYALDAEAFTWQDFSLILQAYNSFDVQIILGPVLRTFMKEKTALKEEALGPVAVIENMTPPQYIDSITERHENGRYSSLAPDVVALLIGNFLGFRIVYVQNGIERAIDAGHPHPTIEIKIYHQGGVEGAEAGGHWERTANLEECIDDEPSSLLRYVASRFNDNPLETNCGIDLLIKHVQAVKNNDLTEIARINLAAQQIEYCTRALNVAPKATIIQLFGANLCPEARDFITEYQGVHMPDGDGLNQLGKHPISAPLDALPVQRVTPVTNHVDESPSVAMDASHKNPILPEDLQAHTHRDSSPTADVDESPSVAMDASPKDSILKLLNGLEAKTAGIGNHHPKAKQVAEALLVFLRQLTKETFENKPNSEQLIKYANTILGQINAARPVLEKDLGWGDYLSNLGLALLNIIIQVVSCGYQSNFFKTKQSFAVEEFEQLKISIVKLSK